MSEPLRAHVSLMSGVSQSVAYLLRHARDDFRRRALRRPHGVPGRNDETSASPASVEVGTSLIASTRFGRGQRQAAQLSARNLRRRSSEPVEHHVDMAGDKILHRGTRPAIRHVKDVGLGLQLEQFAREVVRRAIAGRRVVQLAGICLGEGDQFGERLRLQRASD